MTRPRLRFAAVLLALCAILGCSSDDSPTDPGTACSLSWGGPRTWVMFGGCPSTPTQVTGQSTATFSSCTITLDVTPPAERGRGATWTLTANLQAGTAQVVRANTTCPGTDTGTIRMITSAAVAEVRAAENPACECRLQYTISLPRPV